MPTRSKKTTPSKKKEEETTREEHLWLLLEAKVSADLITPTPDEEPGRWWRLFRELSWTLALELTK